MESEICIRDAAYEAEYIVETFSWFQLTLKYYLEESCQNLQELSATIDHFIVETEENQINRRFDYVFSLRSIETLRQDLVTASQKIKRIFDEVKEIKNNHDIEDKELACANTLALLRQHLRGVQSQIRLFLEENRSFYASHRHYSKILQVSRKIDNILDWVRESPPDIDLQLLRQDLQEISQKISKIIEVKNFKIKPRIDGASSQPDLAGSSRPRTNSEDIMVGFEDELMAVRLRLCGDSRRRQIIPIVGMGGIGKTTLARNLYNDRLIAETFDICGWATIRQEYRALDIFQQLLSIKERKEECVESLIEQLYKYLKGRRYLIILDDIWDGEAWDAVRRALPEDNNGSRVVLTTRNTEVADYIDQSSPPQQMNLLNADQSWDLLREKVFVEESCPTDLEEIGRMISTNCKGLPLAISVIAGVLSVEKTREHWKYVAENIMSALTNSGDDIFELLSLSYFHLPRYLKPCFLYLGAVFPEDHSVNAATLIRLWIAEGFLEPNASRSLEKTAEEYLEDLVKRNLVFFIKRGYNDEVLSCGIHDVLREWCIKRAQEERFFIVDFSSKSKEANVNQCRIAIHSYNADHRSTDMINTQSVRTIMFLNTDKGLKGSIGSCHRLRVLEARARNMNVPIYKILELFQLRYLALYTGDQLLPPSIGRLLNLQTLILEGGYGSLPIEIWGMPKLRHVVVPREWRLPAPPARTIIERRYLLQYLQTLYQVRDLECSKEVAAMMPNLKKLGLFYEDEFSRVEEAVYQLRNLGDITQLESLHLSLKVYTIYKAFRWNPTLLSESLAFPVTLTILHLEQCKFPWKSMTIVGSLPNLEVLQLENEAFEGKEWETREGEFCRLKVLKMKYVYLVHWNVAESTHFPILKYLHLEQCGSLREIPNSVSDISTLELIELKYCGDSVRASARKIEEEQQEMGNDLLQVLIVGSWS